jgi:hypothetical protein
MGCCEHIYSVCVLWLSEALAWKLRQIVSQCKLCSKIVVPIVLLRTPLYNYIRLNPMHALLKMGYYIRAQHLYKCTHFIIKL